MDRTQRQSLRMVFVLLVSAIFCAAATIGAINFVTDRSESPQLSQVARSRQVLVDGILITLNGDPEKTVVLTDELNTPLESPDISPDQPAVAQDQEPSPLPEPTATATLPPPTPIPDPVIFVNYTIRSGDSLFSIAEAQNSSIELMALHGIDDRDLVPGAALNLPVANPAYCPTSQAYVVRDRDTAFRIAQQFGTSADAIRDLNGLDSNYTVRVTQVICVPFG